MLIDRQEWEPTELISASMGHVCTAFTVALATMSTTRPADALLRLAAARSTACAATASAAFCIATADFSCGVSAHVHTLACVVSHALSWHF
jgi:hypothetical protein